MRILVLTVFLGVGIAGISSGGLFKSACPGCGCRQVEKVCRIVPDVKKEAVTRFIVECDEVCVPGKSRRAEPGECAATGCEAPLIPTCGRIIQKKTLKKVTTHVEKPGWKCIVETVCRQCGQHCGQ